MRVCPCGTALGAHKKLIGMLNWPLLKSPAPIALSATAFAAATLAHELP
jgi:hypothetical protein